jgi:hypothetical protein
MQSCALGAFHDLEARPVISNLVLSNAPGDTAVAQRDE